MNSHGVLLLYPDSLLPITYRFQTVLRLFGDGNERVWSLSEVKQLHWRELELMIGAALEQDGYNVKVTEPVKDGGIDVDADRIEILKSILIRPKLVPRRKRLIIDAKQWSEPVDSSPVHKIADTADEQGGTGVIASPSGFRESARGTAEARDVRLYDGEKIVKLFNKTEISQEDIE